MYKNLYLRILTTLFLIILFAVPLFAVKEEDPCKEKDLVIKNLTMTDLWYKKMVVIVQYRYMIISLQ
jgi:hypothetical protein